MSIHDFYSKFVSADEESSLLGTLRKLTLFESPRAMFQEEPLGDWAVWSSDAQELPLEGAVL
ncbi:MAG TPA: hypothetical protein VKM72_20755 [Thermoanaerobaculia bacterium]|nr:hypothetical protein [Thermoanaerobaculia bacterium]